LHDAKKADRFFVPAINIVEVVAILVCIFDFITKPYGLSYSSIIGIGLFVFGMTIYLNARLTLGRFFSEKLRLLPTHELVISGIYGYVRHPIYYGGMFLLLGFTLMLNSFLGFLIMLIYIPLILIRIPFEEKMLKDAFGQRYVDYMKRTKKLIPFLY
jgi:protein-S-isoprenylcysteine O-methyltransferase Ste14